MQMSCMLMLKLQVRDARCCLCYKGQHKSWAWATCAKTILAPTRWYISRRWADTSWKPCYSAWIFERQHLTTNSWRALWHRKMQVMSQIMCLLAKHIQRNRKSLEFMLRLPEISQFPTKGAYDAIRDPFKTVANSERRFVLCTTIMVPHSCWLLL